MTIDVGALTHEESGTLAHAILDPQGTAPKYPVANVVGYITGKSTMHIARTFGERKRNFVGHHFWARGYLVSTVGRDEAVMREYIRNQEKEDERLDQLALIK